MSTLTKILIIVLSIGSIFLCGIVTTYVASAEDYKQKYEAADAELRKARADVSAKNAEVDRVKTNTEQEKANLQAEIGRLQSELATVKGQLAQAVDKRDQLQNDVDQFTSQLEALTVTNENWHAMVQNAEKELMKVNAELIKEKSQNKQVTSAILEKMAIIAQLEEQIKQLNADNEQLQGKLVTVLRQFGKTVGKTAPAPKAPSTIDQVQPQLPAPGPVTTSTQVKEIGLKGVVTQVDLKNSLAEISIGAADGVKEKMRFYASRGDAFICEILILEVYAERAVGSLERVQSPPKSGDSVSTSIGS